MELHQIRYFLAVAETRNFTRAAEACGVSQPSLTRAIQKLEADLGGPLFRRERKQTHLTELGRRLLPRFQQAVSLTDLARNDAEDYANMASGSLTLGAMCTIAPDKLISLIDHINANVPNLRIVLREGTGKEVVQMLMEESVDVVLAALPDFPETVDTVPLYSERFMVACDARHPLAGRESVRLQELDGMQYLRRMNCEYLDSHSAYARANGVSFDVRMESDHESWVQAMVIAGLGMTILPESLVRDPEVLTVPLVEPDTRREVVLGTMRGRRHTPLVELFHRVCRSVRWA